MSPISRSIFPNARAKASLRLDDLPAGPLASCALAQEMHWFAFMAAYAQLARLQQPKLAAMLNVSEWLSRDHKTRDALSASAFEPVPDVVIFGRTPNKWSSV